MGGVCVGTLILFFLRGSNFIDLVHRGVCILNGMARSNLNMDMAPKALRQGVSQAAVRLNSDGEILMDGLGEYFL